MNLKTSFVLRLKSLVVCVGASSLVSHCGETEACSEGLDLGFGMTSLAARGAGSGSQGFWEDSDGVTWAREARLENHRGMKEKQQVATILVGLIKAPTMLLIGGFEGEGLILARSHRGLSLPWWKAAAELS